jgi:hypothetical protein
MSKRRAAVNVEFAHANLVVMCSYDYITAAGESAPRVMNYEVQDVKVCDQVITTLLSGTVLNAVARLARNKLEEQA